MSDLKYEHFRSEKCGTLKFSDVALERLPLTMSYTPMQKIDDLYNVQEALLRGTLFPELDKPFYGKFTGERRV